MVEVDRKCYDRKDDEIGTEGYSHLAEKLERDGTFNLLVETTLCFAQGLVCHLQHVLKSDL